MKILLDEVKPNCWQINVVPESREDLEAGQPSALKLAQILISIGHDCLKRYLQKQEEAEGPKLAMPTPGMIAGLGQIRPEDLPPPQRRG